MSFLKRKRSHGPQKTFLAICNTLLGSVGLLESKITDFRPKNQISEWNWPKISVCGEKSEKEHYF